MDKYLTYASKINDAIVAIFDEENENHIPMVELSEGENANHFFHALSTVVPSRIFNKLTHSNEDHLGFNHIANRLAFQFTKLEKRKTDESAG